MEGFRSQLQKLFIRVRRPTYRSLEAHADQEGRALPTSTLAALLNGPTIPRWETVQTFVRACARYARAHQIRLDQDLVDLDQWHTDYQAMQNALADQAARREQIAGRPVPTRRRRLAVPAQLPSDIPRFTGRVEHLAALHRLLPDEHHRNDPDHGTTAVVITAIDGTAGVGKTALAVHWAHQIRDRFPDGQLYVNLRGFDPAGQIVAPATAVRGFLDALEVPPQRIPADPDAQTALYRSLLIDRRMLLLLDNARDSAQVRTLIPSGPGCLVVVTSRNQLSSLIAATNAHPLTLDLLTDQEARDLLTDRLGTDRVAAEPDATDEIIARCARLPLALTLVAAHAVLSPHTTLQGLAQQLRDTSQRWHALAGDDPTTDVRSVFSWSYRSLTPAAARLFRLLGLHPGPDIAAPAAASLTALPLDQVQPLLSELTRANLLSEPTPGRYTQHDLLRAYATDLLRGYASTATGATDSDGTPRAAMHRLLDHYLHTADHADSLLDPQRDRLTLATPEPGVILEQVADRRQAMDWFTTERATLLAAVDRAAANGFDRHARQLAWVLGTFLYRQGHWHEWAATGRAALAALQRMNDQPSLARACRNLAEAYIRLGQFDDADEQLGRGLELATEAGDQIAQARTHFYLAHLRDRQGEPAAALDHARQALDLYRAAACPTGEAQALNALGWCESQLGNHEGAVANCREALALYRQLDNRVGQAGTLDNLGRAHHRLGQYAEASARLEDSLALYRDLGDRYGEANVLIYIGDARHADTDPTAARAAWQQALGVLTDLDHPDADIVQARLAQLENDSG